MDILVVIQCRYNSRRLPGKALLPLAGVSMLAFLIRRLLGCLPETGWKIVLATTRRQDDDAVARVGIAEGLEVVRGATDDVLGRFCQCLEAWSDARGVVRVTADNPLTCPRSIRDAVQTLLQTGVDYVTCAGFPCGASADVFSAAALRRLQGLATTPAEREHINKYILDHPHQFALATFEADGDLKRPELSLTVDTPEDMASVRMLFEQTLPKPWEMTLQEAIARMDRCPFC